MCLSIFEKIGFSPAQLASIEDNTAGKSVDRQTHQDLLLEDHLYYLFSDSSYLSILSLIETEGFINDIEWIAHRLGIEKRRATKALQTLLELKLIEQKDDGSLIPAAEHIISTNNIPNSSLRLRHQRNSDDAKLSLQTETLERQFFMFETLSFDPDDLPIVQKKIEHLMDDLLMLSQKGKNKSEVYEFCSHYFPRTKNS